MLKTCLAAALALLLAPALAVADAPTRAQPVAQPTKITPPPSKQPAAARPKPSRAAIDELLADTDKIAEKVAKLRGLAVLAPIARGLMTREEIEKRMLELTAEEDTPQELDRDARVAKAFGLLPLDCDLARLTIALLTEQVAGFYDDKAKILHLADWIEVDSQRMVMAHELVHALQDQHFDLEKYMKAVDGDSDAQLARQAVIEGDGVALMLEFQLAEQHITQSPWANDAVVDALADSAAGNSPDSPELSKAPLMLRETLMFPYVEGLRLIAAIRRTQGWDKVDELYTRTPPRSTEQVMHPERFFAGDVPVKITVRKLKSLGKGWAELSHDVMGELMTRVLFQQHGMTRRRAAEAADGWGGDRYTVWAQAAAAAPGDLVIIWAQAWDTDTDADEAFAALGEILPAWSGGQLAPPAKARRPIFVGKTRLVVGIWRTVDAQGRVSWAERRGQKIRVVLHAPAAVEAKLAAETWTAIR
jgi:hypothetical protein